MTDAKITLDSLVGEHKLDAADTYVEKVKLSSGKFEDASCIRFRLDGVVYTAIENPDDGYRSALGSLLVSAAGEVKNIFPPIDVIARKRANDKFGMNDTLELVDKITRKVVLEVGTHNTNDYYPSFVSCFSPENMATTAELKD